MTVNYLIWSFEHQAWWKADELTYTPKRDEAGRFTLARAVEICLEANTDGPNRAVVPVVETE